jgi:hypothetical protein
MEVSVKDMWSGGGAPMGGGGGWTDWSHQQAMYQVQTQEYSSLSDIRHLVPVLGTVFRIRNQILNLFLRIRIRILPSTS